MKLKIKGVKKAVRRRVKNLSVNAPFLIVSQSTGHMNMQAQVLKNYSN